jgi:hypothetical protein
MVQAYGAIQARSHLIRASTCGSGGRYVGVGPASSDAPRPATSPLSHFEVTTVCERELPSSRYPNETLLSTVHAIISSRCTGIWFN